MLKQIKHSILLLIAVSLASAPALSQDTKPENNETQATGDGMRKIKTSHYVNTSVNAKHVVSAIDVNVSAALDIVEVALRDIDLHIGHIDVPLFDLDHDFDFDFDYDLDFDFNHNIDLNIHADDWDEFDWGHDDMSNHDGRIKDKHKHEEKQKDKDKDKNKSDKEKSKEGLKKIK